MPDCDWTPTIAMGRDDPPLGWIAKHFDDKTPSPTVVWVGDILSAQMLHSAIQVNIG